MFLMRDNVFETYHDGVIRGFRLGSIFNRTILDVGLCKQNWDALFDIGLNCNTEDFLTFHIELFGRSLWIVLFGLNWFKK